MATPDIRAESFGHLPSGESVDLYTLVNEQGVTAKITNYGGILVSLRVPDAAGALADIVLGHSHLAGYLSNKPYLGALIGRYANRIANARFTLFGSRYRLAANDGPHHLHGGVHGFDRVLWRASAHTGARGPALQLRYVSKDREEGYPGELDASVTYTLTADCALRIDYEARTDRATVVNLSHHSYFNLRDGGISSILEHELQINADRYTPVDDTLIPTGAIAPVHGTPLDFKRSRRIGAHIDADHAQLHAAGGYDHNFVLNGRTGELSLAALVFEPTTRRTLEVHTTQPGLQFYSGNFLDGTVIGRGDAVYRKRHGFCLETQHFPDSPNKPHFPSTVLVPGSTYRHSTLYKFSVK
jgi:aldose 1-epimerase